MDSKINEILQKIDALKKELRIEYNRMSEQYWFIIKERKIIFLKKIQVYNKKFKEGLFHYIFTANIRNILSVPFIYGMFFPIVLLDIFLTLYQYTAFPLYWIKRVTRKDFITYDRRFLDYLNLLQKINCLYCSYANWLFAYAVEIAWRTELYWCPIKHSAKLEWAHKYISNFADYWDPKWFKEIFNKKDNVLNVLWK